jgi:hypothetical protein
MCPDGGVVSGFAVLLLGSNLTGGQDMKSLITPILAIVCLVSACAFCEASVTTYSDRATFEGQASIVYNYGFEDVALDVNGFCKPGDPWPTHGVTYTTTYNIVGGPGSIWAPITNVFASNNSNHALTATVDTGLQATVLGFDVGKVGVEPSQPPHTYDIRVYTNLNPTGYAYLDLSLPSVSDGMDFYGFITTTPGEYFTGFRLNDGGGIAPAIDNVTLGTVPEPATILIWSLLGGLALLVGRWRRNRAV